jgi:hypothetical protein
MLLMSVVLTSDGSCTALGSDDVLVSVLVLVARSCSLIAFQEAKELLSK